MLEQVNNTITFYAFFVASKLGKTGLTVTVDVYRNGVSVVSAAAATEVGGGLYKYQLASGTVNAEGEYVAVFKTADATIDQQHIPSLWVVGKAGVEDLDAAISSRSSHTAAAVRAEIDANSTKLDAAVSTRLAGAAYAAPDNAGVAAIKTKTDNLPLTPAARGDAMSLTEGERAEVSQLITSALDSPLPEEATASSVNDYVRRASTQSQVSGVFARLDDVDDALADEAATLAAVKSKTDLIIAGRLTVSNSLTLTGNTLTLRRGTTWQIQLTGLGSLAGRSNLYFTVKTKPETQADDQSTLQISETGGLLYLNRAEATGRGAEGSIEVTDEDAGELTVTLEASASDELKPEGYRYDLKVIQAGGDVSAPVEGAALIAADVTRRVS